MSCVCIDLLRYVVDLAFGFISACLIGRFFILIDLDVSG